MNLIDRDHPFFAPLWRRVAIVAVTLGWAAFEFVAGSALWGIGVGALGLYSAYEFFILFEPKNPDDSDAS